MGVCATRALGEEHSAWGHNTRKAGAGRVRDRKVEVPQQVPSTSGGGWRAAWNGSQVR